MRLPDAADDPLAGVRNKGAAVLMPDAWCRRGVSSVHTVHIHFDDWLNGQLCDAG